MRKGYFSYYLILLTSIVLAACQNNEVIYPEANPAVIGTYSSIEELAETPLTVENTAGNALIKIQSAQKWELSSNQKWCTVSESKGSSYSVINLSYTENPLDEPRSAELVFKINGEEDQTVTLTQKAIATFITLDKQTLAFGLNHSSQKVKMTTNASAWTITVTDAATNEPANWCSVDPNAGQGNKELSITVAANDSKTERAAVITVTGASDSKNIEVIQKGSFDSPVITLSTANTLKAAWQPVIGANGYELVIRDGADKASSTIIETIGDIAPGATEYDLTDHIYPNNYIGIVYIELNAYTIIGGNKIYGYSNIESCHNYYDIASGNGTAGSEFIISNIRHLNNLSRASEKNFKLSADIDATDFAYAPVESFGGMLDGNNKKIMNLNLSLGSMDKVGLFKVLETGGVVKNILFDNSNITGQTYVGSIAGDNQGTITNIKINAGCSVKTSIAGAEPAYTGGICGVNSGNISDCENNAVINATNLTGNYIGGITGGCIANGTISSCKNTGRVSGNTHIGGITGTWTGTSESRLSDTNITRCSNSGNVSSDSKGNKFAGGIIGSINFNALSIQECFNTGAVSAGGSTGGILGRCSDSGAVSINNCYNTGALTCQGPLQQVNNTAGGMIGGGIGMKANVIAMTITNCYNTGIVSNNLNPAKACGITPVIVVGAAALGNNICLDGAGSKETGSFGTAIGYSFTYANKTDTEMKQQNTYTGWDFTDIWTINSNYPTLKRATK